MGLMERGQGIVLCKRVASRGLPERRGYFWGIWWGGCACPIPLLLPGMLLQRRNSGKMQKRFALLSPSSCSRRVTGEAGEWEEGVVWAGVCMAPYSSGMSWSEATGLPLGAAGAGVSGVTMGPCGCWGSSGAGGGRGGTYSAVCGHLSVLLKPWWGLRASQEARQDSVSWCE